MHNLNAVNFSNGTNMGSLSLPSARCLHRSHNALRSLVCARSWDMKTKQDRDTSSVTRKLSPVQTDGTLLANNSQHCRMLHVASFANNVECCCMLLRVVGSCSAKFETGQKFEPTTARPNISFGPWSPKRSATTLDHFHTSSNIVVVGHARVLHKDTTHKTFETIPRCTACLNIAGSYCIPLHTTAETDATTPNIAGPTMLEVVVSVCK